MSDHIDHAAEAEAILADIRPGLSADMVAAAAAGAQVHATLALVEAVREVGTLLAYVEIAPVVDDGAEVSEGGMEVRTGDPDPTPNYPWGGYCGARGPEHGGICTWGAEHEGAHVAGDGMIAVEVWS